MGVQKLPYQDHTYDGKNTMFPDFAGKRKSITFEDLL